MNFLSVGGFHFSRRHLVLSFPNDLLVVRHSKGTSGMLLFAQQVCHSVASSMLYFLAATTNQRFPLQYSYPSSL